MPEDRKAGMTLRATRRVTLPEGGSADLDSIYEPESLAA
jgi:hypothetical protein